MKADALFVIMAIVFIFIAWVATGGPTRPIATAGPFITPVTRSGEESQGYRQIVPSNPINSNSYPKQVNGASASISSGATTLTRSADGNSSYSSSVYLERSTTGPSSGNPNQEFVSIVNSGTANVTISGWRLSSKATGASATIPNGTEIYRSSGGSSNTAIVLKPGDKTIVLTGRSPIGISFKENICTGYIAQFQTFTPSLTLMCPSPATEIEDAYRGSDAGACEDTTTRIPRCAVFASGGSSSSCSSFLKEALTYSGCLDRHSKDASFALQTWRVFLDRNLEMWAKSRETITLTDSSGKVVDTFTY